MLLSRPAIVEIEASDPITIFLQRAGKQTGCIPQS